MSNPSVSLIHEPHAFHTSPMLPPLAVCGPKTFFVMPVPHTLPLKAIVVLSTSFSPLERSILPGQAFRRTKMSPARSWRRVLLDVKELALVVVAVWLRSREGMPGLDAFTSQ